MKGNDLQLLKRMPPRIYVLLSIMTLIVPALLAFAFDSLVTVPQHQKLTERVKAHAASQAAAVDEFVAQHQQQLAGLARDPALISSLGDDDRQTAINNWLAGVSQAGTPFSTIEVVPVADLNVENSRNFVEINLINRTRNGENPAPEATRSQAWQIHFARPVLVGEQVVATLLAVVPARFLANKLNAVDHNLGRAILIQKVEYHPPVSIAAQGRGSENLPAAERATSVPHWSIRYVAAPELIETIRSHNIYFWLVAAVLTIVYLFIAGKLVRQGLNSPVSASSPRTTRRKSVQDQPVDKEVKAEDQRKSFTAPVYEFDKTRTSIRKKTGEEGPGNKGATKSSPKADQPLQLPARVFRDYDIRGLANEEINEAFAEALGKVLGTRAVALDESAMVLGYDGRTSSPALSQALAKGILSTGCNLINLGQIPTPLMNFATRTLSQTDSGVMVTASHNPAADNGFKVVFNGHVLNAGEITELREAMARNRWRSGKGEEQNLDVRQQYLDSIVGDIAPATGLRVVIDCGNGIAGTIAPALLEAIGCEVTQLYCDVDGNFPNHPPDPTVSENLADLITVVTHNKADVGLAIDGDGDRLVAVTASGRIVWPDELLMIFARDVTTRHPGSDVIFDVKSTRRLNSLVSSYGGRPVMWKTGHAHMRNKMAETGAPVGGEFSGHLFFNDRWHGFDDGIYASARLVEILSMREQSLDDLMASFPETITTPEIRIAVDDLQKFGIIEKLRQQGDFGEGKITDIDGLRVDYPEGWGLARASNTGAALTLRFEAIDNATLSDIKNIFKAQLQALGCNLALDF